MAVRAGVVNDEQVARFDLRQFAINGELVVIFTQRPDDIDRCLRRSVFLAEHRNMVIRTVHAGPH